MDLTKFNKNDRSIIEANKGATVEQLRALGVTPVGIDKYIKLLEENDDFEEETPVTEEKNFPEVPPPAPVQTTIPQPVITSEIPTFQPKLVNSAQAGAPQFRGNSGYVRVAGPTGNVVNMNRKQAERLVKKNPTKFKILN